MKYLVDTNVLLSYPEFVKQPGIEIILTYKVICELDSKKYEPGTLGLASRTVSKWLDAARKNGDLATGVLTEEGNVLRVILDSELAMATDDALVEVAYQMTFGKTGSGEDITDFTGADSDVILLSNDTNVRIKGALYGVAVESWGKTKSDNVNYQCLPEILVPDAVIQKIYTSGVEPVPEWELVRNSYYMFKSEINEKSTAVCFYDGDSLQKVLGKKKMFGLMHRNVDQMCAIDALMKPEIPLVTLIGKAGSGKCSSIDSLVYTPSGPVKMGNLKAGDIICTPDGKTAPILSVHPQGKKDFYRVVFTDGSSTETCDEHLWLTQTSLERDQKKPGKVRELKEIMNSLRYGASNKRNHSIPITKPVFFEDKEVFIDPYLMGCLLGDGSLKNSISFTNNDEEILQQVKEHLNQIGDQINKKKNRDIDYSITGTHTLYELNRLDMRRTSNSKFIPDDYKFTSAEKRLAILQGLMDTDGTIHKDGMSVTFTSVSEQLAKDVVWLVQSLGGTAVTKSRIPKYTYKGNKKEGQKAYTVFVCFPNEVVPFRVSRKVSRLRARTKYFPRRYIDKVESLGKKEGQCIYVDHPDHLYITDDFIVTHNTLLAVAAGLEAVLEKKAEGKMTCEKLLIIRPPIPMGTDVGYLPGDLSAKLSGYAGSITDNLDVLCGGQKNVDHLFANGTIEIVPPTFMRGRSLNNTFVILDEAQSLTRHEIKTIATRLGENSKLVITGDLQQIDNPRVSSSDNGLAIIVEAFKGTEWAICLDLIKGERSDFSAAAAELL